MIMMTTLKTTMAIVMVMSKTGTCDDDMSYLQMPMSMICFTKSSFGRNFSRLKIRLLPSLSSPPRRPSFSPPRLKGRAEDLPSRLCWDQAKPSGIDDKYLPEEEAWTDDREEGLG